MKKLLIIFLLSAACQHEKPQISFQEKNVTFNAREGNNVKKSFSFTNTGTGPLKITKVDTDCTCTKATYPEKDILPGETSNIEVIYSTKFTEDSIKHIIVVHSNTDPILTTLTLKGKVVSK